MLPMKAHAIKYEKLASNGLEGYFYCPSEILLI